MLPFLLLLLSFPGASSAKAPSPPPAKSETPAVNRFEFRTAPLAFLARWYTLEGLYRINEHWAVGPSFVDYDSAPIGNMFFPSYKGHSYGVAATYYFLPVREKGWFATFRYYYDDFTTYAEASFSHFYNRGHSLIGVAGYHLPIYKNTFAMMGGGPHVVFYERTERKEEAVTHIINLSTNPNYSAFGLFFEGKVGIEF